MGPVATGPIAPTFSLLDVGERKIQGDSLQAGAGAAPQGAVGYG